MTPLTREQIASVRSELAAVIVLFAARMKPEQRHARCATFLLENGANVYALLDIAEAVANAPQVEVTACNQIPGASDFDHGDMLSAILPLKPGTRVAVLPLAGEVANG